MKVNPATAASATFANASGDSLIISSADFGEFANQISVQIADGTVKGKLVTAIFEDITEAVDDIGGDTMFTLQYRPPNADPDLGTGWDLMTADVLASGVRANATRTLAGQDTDVLLSETGAFTAVSDNAGDTQTIFVLGIDAATPIVRTATLNGVTPVAVGSFDGGVFGAWVSTAAVGTIDVDQTGTNLTIAPAALSTGGQKGSATFVNLGDVITLVVDAAEANDLYIVGRTSAGARVVEAVTLNGTTPVPSVGTTIVEVEFWGMGAVTAARTVTATATALQSVNTTQTTLVKLSDFFNARQVANTALPTSPFGFDFTLVTGLTTLDSANLDLTAAAVDIDTPATGSFFADLFFLVDAINNQFALINATEDPAAVGVPDNTVSQVFLTGGSEGTTTFQDWQDALNLLKLIRVNSIVVLTGDPAVHAALKAHCEFMGGIGRSERDGFVGLLNTPLTGLPTKTEIASQIVALNSRHLRAFAQRIERFNVEGERTTFDPPFLAVVAAGMQAGSPVGTSLTFKIANALSVTQDQTWNPVDDAEELIEDGLVFLEEIDNIGRRWVRNVTTNVSSSNIAFTEGSVNEAINFAVFNFRTNLEFAVGRLGFAGTVNATKGIAINTLGLLVDTTVITQFRSLQITLSLDVLDVSVEIAPVIPINFVRNVLHLFNPVLAAA